MKNAALLILLGISVMAVVYLAINQAPTPPPLPPPVQLPVSVPFTQPHIVPPPFVFDNNTNASFHMGTG
jgi:hypothetical protein